MNISQGTVINGKYRIERRFGSGGMGSVWVARHLALKSEVAIKFINASIISAPVARMRFEREAMTAAQVSSDYIVKMHDYGIDSDTPFIVMELLHGEDLMTRFRREGRLSLMAASEIAVQVSRALRKLHEAAIVHRDLKPGNIFIVRSDDEERIKLLDFGVAKRVGSLLDEGTQTGDVIGSPPYMSPEQFRDSRGIDARSDLWAFAVILFRAVTGVLPFAGETVDAIIAKILFEPIPLPSSIVGDLPPAIDAFFRRALTRDVEQRFQTAREFAEAFVEAAGITFAGPSSFGFKPSLQESRPSVPPASSQPPVTQQGAQPLHMLSNTQTNAVTTLAGAAPARRIPRSKQLTLLALMAGAAFALTLLLVAVSSTAEHASASSLKGSMTGQPIHTTAAQEQPAAVLEAHRGAGSLQALAELIAVAQAQQGAEGAPSAIGTLSVAATSIAPQTPIQKVTGSSQASDASQKGKGRLRPKCSGPLPLPGCRR